MRCLHLVAAAGLSGSLLLVAALVHCNEMTEHSGKDRNELGVERSTWDALSERAYAAVNHVTLVKDTGLAEEY